MAQFLPARTRPARGRRSAQRIQTLAPDEPTPYHSPRARRNAADGAARHDPRIFDNYADRFDAHLLGALQYRVPARCPPHAQRTPSLNIDVLDLGCGTGLIGAELGRVDGSLVGVDLSAKMLERQRCSASIPI
jgi:SAM-dependent methyltransferase